MQLSVQMEGSKNGGSEQASSSYDGQLLVALRNMKKALVTSQQAMETSQKAMVTSQEAMVASQQATVILENLIRVKEGIQSAEMKLFTEGTRNYANEMTTSKERSLQLKFLDEVSDCVLTGKVIYGKGGNSMRVALVDKATGQVVNCGPESSAQLEILVLDANGDDNEHIWTHENFTNRIIMEGDKKKPHFAKSIYINLKEGVGILDNAKLGNDSNWTKDCKCRLGARIMENFGGIEVQEAWTESFIVSDNRRDLTRKHHPPFLSSEVWRLEGIGKGGGPCKRLKMENISTVRDFLLFHSVHPQKLKEDIVCAGDTKWVATVNHAQKCVIDDKKMYLYYPSTKSEMGVIFDAVGGLKGVIDESRYVPVNNLSADEEERAHKLRLSAFEYQKDNKLRPSASENQKDNKLRLSAFEHRKDITTFEDEESLLRRFPYRSSDINGYNSADPGTSSQTMCPTTFYLPNDILKPYETGLDVPETSAYQAPDIGFSGPFGSLTTGQHQPYETGETSAYQAPDIAFSGPFGSLTTGQHQPYETGLDAPEIPNNWDDVSKFFADN